MSFEPLDAILTPLACFLTMTHGGGGLTPPRWLAGSGVWHWEKRVSMGADGLIPGPPQIPGPRQNYINRTLITHNSSHLDLHLPPWAGTISPAVHPETGGLCGYYLSCLKSLLCINQNTALKYPVTLRVRTRP